MNIVDSSGWISYLLNDSQAANFAGPIESVRNLLVPSVTITEVFRFVERHSNRKTALNTITCMHTGLVVALDTDLAVEAAIIGLDFKLPLADSIIYTTAQKYGAMLWTQDADFEGLPGVKYFPQ